MEMWISFSNVQCEISLTQPSSVMIKPGGSLSISCKVSGYSVTDNSYATGWIRQPAGKTLEWINHIWGGGSITQKDSLKSKFSISKDSSSSSVTLQGQNMQPEDTAVYYCVRRPHSAENIPKTLTKTPTHTHMQFILMIKPGGSLSISCKVSGYSVTDNSYATGWIRQPAGKTLEWINYIWGGGSTYQKDSLKSKFSISKDSSSSSVTLQAQNMQPEDTAVYYCVRRPHSAENIPKTLTKTPTHTHMQFICQHMDIYTYCLYLDLC
uniref:Ig-like domain-containing protein n=1 Tax=Astyanax mexicanus TaxID=7994 RepID=A0A3B1IKQ0_ASTMX